MGREGITARSPRTNPPKMRRRKTQPSELTKQVLVEVGCPISANPNSTYQIDEVGTQYRQGHMAIWMNRPRGSNPAHTYCC